jgi:hypothetical protein
LPGLGPLSLRPDRGGENGAHFEFCVMAHSVGKLDAKIIVDIARKAKPNG